MNLRTRIKGVAVIVAVAASIVGGSVLLDASKAEAARCCWVMVCNDTGCWEVCKTCPKFP